MADDLDAQIEKAMKEKVILRAQEIIKGLALEYWRFITANSLETGKQFGSPVLSGRFYRSHNISLGSIVTTTMMPNPAGSEKPYSAQPLSTAVAVLVPFRLGESIFFANALPYARKIEVDGHSAKAPDGVYQVAADLLKSKFKNTGANIVRRV